MATKIFTTAYLEELRMETASTRKCLERIPLPEIFNFKPHEKSMEMGYLTLLVAEIPAWIAHMIEDSEIDFVTYPHAKIETAEQLMVHFEENLTKAEAALLDANDDTLEEIFTLKANGEIMYTSPKKIDIRTTLNHWVHHRGQLTVYMRMNDILIPSIYGPSADDKSF